jgi:hypothetical protein
MLIWRWNNLVVWLTVKKCSTSTKPHMTIEHHKDCYTVMSTWQHRLNIWLRTCQECNAVTSRPRFKIRTLEIGNTWFVTNFPSLHFCIFCQITEFSYGPGLTGHSVCVCVYIYTHTHTQILQANKIVCKRERLRGRRTAHSEGEIALCLDK